MKSIISFDLSKALASISLTIRSLCLAAVLSSCGGGGGGGTATSSTGIRVLHGAVEATPVDLVLDNSGVMQTIRFGKAGQYISLGEGQHLATLYRARSSVNPILNRSIVNQGDQKFTIIFYGDREKFGLQTRLLEEFSPQVPSGSSFIRLIHAAIGAAAANLTIAGKSADALFGNVSDYIDVPPGIHNFVVRRSVDRQELSQGALLLEEGRSYTIFVSGEEGFLVNTQVLEE